MSTNPFTQYRIDNRFTYAQAARELGVSVTYLQRLNDGMVYPSVDLLHTLYMHRGPRPAEAMREFEEWAQEELRKVHFPEIPLDKDTSLDVWNVYAEMLCQMNGLERSRLAVCGLLKFNPAILSKWESNNMKNIPSIILERINEYK